MRHAAPRAREETPDTVTVGAAHRSAARAWGARPVPFRTRKLSPIAPRVLRGQPVGGQGAADRWTAPGRHPKLKKGGGLAASPLFCVIGNIPNVIKSIQSSTAEYRRSPFCGRFSVLNGLIFALTR